MSSDSLYLLLKLHICVLNVMPFSDLSVNFGDDKLKNADQTLTTRATRSNGAYFPRQLILFLSSSALPASSDSVLALGNHLPLDSRTLPISTSGQDTHCRSIISRIASEKGSNKTFGPTRKKRNSDNEFRR